MIQELINEIIDLVNEQRDSQGQISKDELEINLLLVLEGARVKNNYALTDVSKLTLEEGKQMVDFGFWYATESMHDGSVPVGNYLQRLMFVKGFLNSPQEWNEYKRKNGYDC